MRLQGYAKNKFGLSRDETVRIHEASPGVLHSDEFYASQNLSHGGKW